MAKDASDVKVKRSVPSEPSPSKRSRRKPNKSEKTLRTVIKRHRHKQGVVVSSRVHPGEAQSSWVVQGLINFLLSEDPVAVQLRSQFVFKVVPMLNPDGVVYGNYRCSLLGLDLNRRWHDPSKTLDPTVFFTKRLLKVLQEEREVLAFFDLHGHSRKKNAFMYGCEHSGADARKRNFMLRALPALFGAESRIFKFDHCSFKCEKAKEKTGRLVCFKELGVRHSFTLETSFYGREREEEDAADADMHMGVGEFEKLGEELCKTIWHYQQKEYLDELEYEASKFEY